MAVKQVSVFDVLRGLVEKSAGEFYEAREQITTEFATIPPSFDEAFMPPQLLTQASTANVLAGEIASKGILPLMNHKVANKGFVDRNFWWILLFLILIIISLIWYWRWSEKKWNEKEEWSRLKKSVD